MSERLIHFLKGIILTIFVVCFFKRSMQPPLGSEVDFFRPIEIWVTQGPQSWGIWHSPYYTWLISLMGRLFGFTPWIVRSVGFFCLMGSGFLMLRIFKTLADEMKIKIHPSYEILLWFTALASPLAISSALIVDFDNTVLLFFTSLFFYTLVWLRQFENPKPSMSTLVLILGAVMALCLMGKETTPILYPVAVLIVFRSAQVTAWAALVQWGLFLVVSWLWFIIFGLEMFPLARQSLQAIFSEPDFMSNLTWLRAVWIRSIPLLWLGLPIGILAFWRIPLFFRSSRLSQAMAVVVLSVILVYSWFRQMTGYYPLSFTPVLLWIPFFLLLFEAKIHPKGILERGEKVWIWMLAGLGLILPDPLELIYYRLPAELWRGLLMVGVLFFLWGIARLLEKAFSDVYPVHLRAPFLSSMILLSMIPSSVSYWKKTLFTDQSVTYRYGERALIEAEREVLAWRNAKKTELKFTTQQKKNLRIYSPAKDIAYALRDQGVQYMDPAGLSRMTPEICSLRSPLLIVTRIREASSLERAPELSELRKCLIITSAGKDIQLGMR